MKYMHLVLAFLAILGFSFTSLAGGPSHDGWTKLLQKHVTEQGNVNYKGLVKDSVELNAYLELLAKKVPDDSWTYEEAKAYWINAYNAFTVKLIVDNYPVKSIKELGGSIYKVNTPWAKDFIVLEGDDYSLDKIEHGILREDFADPRIHFAVNCASYSCPRLRNEAFTADDLERQLDEQASYFINNKTKNKITASSIQVSKIFKWFKGDFTKGQTVIEFLNKFSDVKINEDADVDYLDYGWDLNE